MSITYVFYQGVIPFITTFFFGRLYFMHAHLPLVCSPILGSCIFRKNSLNSMYLEKSKIKYACLRHICLANNDKVIVCVREPTLNTGPILPHFAVFFFKR